MPSPTPPPRIPDLIPTLEPDIPAEQFETVHYQLLLYITPAVLLLAAVVLVWVLRRRKRRSIPAPSPGELALKALQDIGQELPPLRECSLRISLTLRAFLAGQTQDSSLYETHEEFSRRMDSLAGVPMSCREKTARMLEDLAAMKYTPQQETDAARARTMTDDAIALVQEIVQVQAESAERGKEDEV